MFSFIVKTSLSVSPSGCLYLAIRTYLTSEKFQSTLWSMKYQVPWYRKWLDFNFFWKVIFSKNCSSRTNSAAFYSSTLREFFHKYRHLCCNVFNLFSLSSSLMTFHFRQFGCRLQCLWRWGKNTTVLSWECSRIASPLIHPLLRTSTDFRARLSSWFSSRIGPAILSFRRTGKGSMGNFFVNFALANFFVLFYKSNRTTAPNFFW